MKWMIASDLHGSAFWCEKLLEAFEREYANFREEPLVSEFLAAELAFCRMMQDINLHLTEAVHFE